MSRIYEEVDLLEMNFSEEEEVFKYPCPCGDKFFISIDDLMDNEDKAKCPSCSLILQVRYDPEQVDDVLDRLEQKLDSSSAQPQAAVS